MIEVEIDRHVFNPVYRPHLENMARTQIYYGGSSSGKSYFLAERTVYDILGGGRNYLIVRQVGRYLRGSVYQQIINVLSGWGVLHLFDVHKTDMLITCKNGYQIIFAGLDDVEKLKSLTPAKGAITDIWVEEATETERNTIKQLYKRQRGGSKHTRKRMTFSFNPILQSSWLYTDYFAPLGWAEDQTSSYSDTLSILKTTYKDNRFLTPEDVEDLESESDKYFYNVYTLGNWGVLGHAIFTNWTVRDLSEMRDQFTNPRHGLDFGFSSDPAAMPCTHYDKAHKTIYVYDELYERGLTNDLLAVDIKQRIGRQYVTCDSAEPKSIAELQGYGVNALPAKKGKDSVVFGVQWLQQRQIVVDSRCVHTQNELRQYHWKEDKDGNALRIPVDKYNHAIDGLRYAYEDEAGGAWDVY